jgi:predicted RNA-binding Zn-ribbon protein involved in translation (DUF1610 family)
MRMSVKLIPLTCPSCGGQLEIPDEPRDFYCQYCGTRIRLDDGSTNININQTVTIRDEAELRRLDILERNQQEQREKELERERRKHPTDPKEYQQRWRRILLGFPISFAVLFVGTALISAMLSVVFEVDTTQFDDMMPRLLTAYFGLGLPVWIGFVIAKRPRKPR